MDTVLGLFGVAIWIVAVIAVAAAVTYVVVKLTPGDRSTKAPETGKTG
jgi:archaellin